MMAHHTYNGHTNHLLYLFLEGCGKSTLISGLKNDLMCEGRQIIYTREPGGCKISEEIRKIVSSRENDDIAYLTELLMIYAARNEHIDKVINPSLEKGHVVITDRYYDSSYAYQVGGQKINPSILEALDSWVVKEAIPNLTILLKVPIETCLERVNQRGKVDRFDEQGVDFFMNVQAEFNSRAKEDPSRVVVIEGTQTEQAVLEQVKAQIENKVKACCMNG